MKFPCCMHAKRGGGRKGRRGHLNFLVLTPARERGKVKGGSPSLLKSKGRGGISLPFKVRRRLAAAAVMKEGGGCCVQSR